MERARSRVYARSDERVLFGVCAGMARHLGLDPVVLRLAFVLLTVGNGIGIGIYLVLWLILPRTPVPEDEPGAPIGRGGSAAGAEGDGGDGTATIASRAPAARGRDYLQLAAYAALALGLSMLTWLGGGLTGLALWPIVIGAMGAALLWQQADAERRQRWRRTTRGMRRIWVRSLLGALLVLVGIGGFLFSRGQLAAAAQAFTATLVIVLGVAVIVAPWLVNLVRDLDDERRERIRSQERAELAAHIHDSVLHTLTLIQRNSADPREVQRLARAQERELRGWLYQPRRDSDRTLAAAVAHVAAEVEDAHGLPIEVVCVGDCPLDERLGAMLQAAREAMVNAAKHAGAPVISVYAEVEPGQVTVFVRDRGSGFDLESVSADRMGVRQSIIGRMERNSGRAVLRSAPGAGTEVELMVRRESERVRP